MTQTNQVFIITFAIILLGFLLKKYSYISEKEGKTISKFLMHTTFPALMFISAATAKLEASLMLIPLFCICLGILMIIVGWFWFKNYSNDLRGVLMMGVGGFNSGLFGFPLIERLFGKSAMIFAIMFDIGVTVIVFGAIYPLAIYFSANKIDQKGVKPILKKVLTLPPVLCMIVGLIINILAIPVPAICMDFMEILAKANKPIVLLLMGIYLSFELNKKVIFAISKVLFLRYSIGLLMVIALYFLLPNYPMMRNILMICVLLPVGMTILPFSDELNYDSRIAGTLLNLTLLVSFILIWGLVLFL